MEFNLNDFLQPDTGNNDLLSQAMTMSMKEENYQPVEYQPVVQQPCDDLKNIFEGMRNYQPIVQQPTDDLKNIFEEMRKINSSQKSTLNTIVTELKTFNKILEELKSLNKNVNKMIHNVERIADQRTGCISTPVKVPIQFDVNSNSLKNLIEQITSIMKQRSVSPSSCKRKSTDETPKQPRKKVCEESYRIQTVTGKGEHSDHIDKIKIQKEKTPKQPRKKTCEESYRIPTVSGRGAHSKHIDNCKIQKRK